MADRGESYLRPPKVRLGLFTGATRFCMGAGLWKSAHKRLSNILRNVSNGKWVRAVKDIKAWRTMCRS